MKTFLKHAVLGLALFTTVILGAHVGDALAQAVTSTTTDSSGSINIPIGQWISSAAATLSLLTVPLVGFLFRRLPSQWSGMLLQARVDTLLSNAINYGINSVAQATQDKSLSAPVANDVLRSALQYAVDNAPNLVKLAGGADLIVQKIIARLNLEEGASVVAASSAAVTASTASIVAPKV